MRRKIRRLLFVLFFGVSFFYSSSAHAQPRNKKVVIYMFWGTGCPHCKHEKPFLEGLKFKYPGLEVKSYEVWFNEENKTLYKRLADAYGSKGGSVPATFIGEKFWIGYSQEKSVEIEKQVKYCLEKGCPTVEMVLNNTIPVGPGTSVSLPGLGNVDATKMALPLLTVILAGLDGFNPCAFFVLLMLLSLLVHARSRGRMLIVGGIFVFFSGFIYFLFMAAWLNLFLIMGKVNLITTGAGVMAVIIALINIKEYFAFGKGISLTIPKSAKPALFERMRNLLKTSSFPGLVIGTVVLSILANTYELLCTAGFPMVYTRVLTLRGFPTAQYYFYLAFYNVIYIIPLALIVVIFTITLGSRKLTDSEGRILKLISGLMMLGLGVMLVVKPDLLNNVFVSVGMIIGALTIGALIRVLKKNDNGPVAKGRNFGRPVESLDGKSFRVPSKIRVMQPAHNVNSRQDPREKSKKLP